MSVKTIFQTSQNLRQNAKLSALAMAEYYENKERILKSITSDGSLGEQFVNLSVELPNTVDGSNTLASINIQSLVQAIDNGDDVVDVITHTSSAIRQNVQMDLDNVLNAYASAIESASAYGCFFRTIAESMENGQIEVSNFISSCSTKLSNLNSGVVDYLTSILKASRDPSNAIQVVANESLAPDLSNLVFNPEYYGSDNMFLSTVASIASDLSVLFVDVVIAVKQGVNLAQKISAAIGATIVGLIKQFVPNVLEDYELGKSSFGILDTPIVSFYVPEENIENFIDANSDASGFSNSKKFSGLRYHTGSQYYADLRTAYFGWDRFFEGGLRKLKADIDKTGIVEIPVSWGVIRCFKHGSNYYFYLYLQFEGQEYQESEYNKVIAIPATDNQTICNKVYEAIDGLLESMSQFPILSTKPTWPSSDDLNDFLFWYIGDPSDLTDANYKYRLFLDPSIFNSSSRESSSSNKLIESLNFKNLDISALTMDGNLKEQIILSYMLFEICYCYDTRAVVFNSDFGIDEIYNGQIFLGDIQSQFTNDQFVPYYTYASAPMLIHPQTVKDRANEFKKIYIAVLLTIATAVVSVTLFKVKKKVRMKALFKQSMAYKAQQDLINMDTSDPQFKATLNNYYKSWKSASLWSKLSGICGESMSGVFNHTDTDNTMSKLMKLITG